MLPAARGILTPPDKRLDAQFTGAGNSALARGALGDMAHGGKYHLLALHNRR